MRRIEKPQIAETIRSQFKPLPEAGQDAPAKGNVIYPKKDSREAVAPR
jgi:hypothetical protein